MQESYSISRGPNTPFNPRQRSRPVRILLVEDHVDTAQVMRKLLEKTGHHVTVAGSFAGAVQSAQTNQIDLLICDVGLPDRNGLDLLRELRQRQSVEGICLSGHGGDEDVQQSQLAGFAAHLTKPIDISRLESVIDKVAARVPVL